MEKTENKTIILQLVARILTDGSAEIIADALNGYSEKDALKVRGYQFCKDRSLGLGTDVPLNQNGERSKSAAWRKILAVLSPEATPAALKSSLEAAISEIDEVKKQLPDLRVKGGKNVTLKLTSRWPGIPEVTTQCARIEAMDTPWQPAGAESEAEAVLTPGE